MLLLTCGSHDGFLSAKRRRFKLLKVTNQSDSFLMGALPAERESASAYGGVLEKTECVIFFSIFDAVRNNGVRFMKT